METASPQTPLVATALALLREALPDLVAAYVFGSAADGALRRESDLDLALLPAAPLEAGAQWELAQRVAAAIGRDVDLIDLLTTTDVLRAQVLGTGRPIYVADPSAVAFFEARALGAYARLNETRRAIVADFRARVGAERHG